MRHLHLQVTYVTQSLSINTTSITLCYHSIWFRCQFGQFPQHNMNNVLILHSTDFFLIFGSVSIWGLRLGFVSVIVVDELISHIGKWGNAC